MNMRLSRGVLLWHIPLAQGVVEIEFLRWHDLFGIHCDKDFESAYPA